MTSPLRIGEQAPDFSLPCTLGSEFSLSQTLTTTNVLLAFYALDFTAPGAAMLSKLADIVDKLAEANTAITGISIDSVYTHNAFATKLRLPFPLVSDFNRTASARYGVLAGQLLGLNRVCRTVIYLIARDGTVRYRWIGEGPSSLPNVQEILDATKSLQP